MKASRYAIHHRHSYLMDVSKTGKTLSSYSKPLTKVPAILIRDSFLWDALKPGAG